LQSETRGTEGIQRGMIITPKKLLFLKLYRKIFDLTPYFPVPAFKKRDIASQIAAILIPAWMEKDRFARPVRAQL
jgi:hypothetical protein